MDSTDRMAVWLGLFGLLAIGLISWRGCDHDRAIKAMRHESFRSCVQIGKPPLECDKAIP